MNIVAWLADFMGSKTIGFAIRLIPLLSRAFDLKKAPEWIYNRLPEDIKAKGTLTEFQAVIDSGMKFMQACWSFIH